MLVDIDRDKGFLILRCNECKTNFQSKYEKNRSLRFLEQFEEYENIMTEPCPTCGMFIVLNMNLPKEELKESFFDLAGFPEEERQQRRLIKMLLRDRGVFD